MINKGRYGNGGSSSAMMDSKNGRSSNDSNSNSSSSISISNNDSKIFCVIGDPVEHSLSPAMHNAVFSSLGLGYRYIAMRVKEHELSSAVEMLRDRALGFNVTIPHKIRIMDMLDDLDPLCKRVNAVNTVKVDGSRLKGYNTDVYGFIQPLRRRGIELRGKSVMIMGAGGAARAVLIALIDEHVGEVIIASRRVDDAKVKALYEMAVSNGIECRIVQLEYVRMYSKQCYLIVNATPIGMQGYHGYEDVSILDSNDIDSRSIVYDLVYRPMETRLIRNALNADAMIIHGYEMLVEQGAKALDIWLGIDAPRDVMSNAVLRYLAFGDRHG
ncbi:MULTISPECIES: shikimate dehydrogenase [Candidatus Nitrosocaldus]|jgi:shikimate dehydrogenase|uniref:Shikimate dehydrogenase (NADP(+)) n=1 Tax=Candidatus Nitrosocaldus cavascurensis TaxID=2058097 RepID=A0A2K5APK2_9ARCH|nr:MULTISPECIES: shikimate dehydrogenase [Candidatus Nitrosocaldus]SPC33581.1 Shikimate dehydrogenase (NADP(+)) [Candidatus Nitrosocaldus cavascurensis]